MRWYGVILVLVALGAGALPAGAQEARGHVRAGRVQPLDEILEGIRNSRPGTFYDAQGPFEGPDGRMHYRLKWMTPEGRILWLDTDAQTGRVLGVDRGQRRPAWERGGGQDRERRNFERDDNGPPPGGYGPPPRDYRRDRSGWGDYDRPNGRGNGRSRGNDDHNDNGGPGDRHRRPHGW